MAGGGRRGAMRAEIDVLKRSFLLKTRHDG
jgi:hypothetical protein